MSAVPHRLTIAFIALLSLAMGAQAVEVLQLDPMTERISLNQFIERIEDPGGSLTLDEVRAPERAPHFVAGSAGIGHSTLAWWMRLRIHNASTVPLERRLDLGNRTLQEVDLYVSTPDGGWQRQATGSTLPFAARPIATGNFALPLTLAANATTEVYLRVRSTGYLGVIVTPSLWQPTAHQSAWHEEIAIWMLATGVFLAMATLNLFLFAYVRERRYLLYSLSVLSFLVGINSSVGGYGGAYAYLWPTSPVLEQAMWVVGILIPSLFPVWFIAEVIHIPQHHPRIWRLVLVCQTMLLIAIIAQVGGTLLQRPELANLLQRFYLIVAIFWAPIYPSVVWAAFHSWRQGDRMARYLAIGYVPLFLCIAVGVLMMIEGEPFPWSYAIAAGVFETLVMALALADSFFVERRDKLAAQAETIATLQHSERVLEAKVIERTAELADEKHRTQDLLHNILPASVAADLAAHGSAKPVELRSATILFTDFSGFTQIASTMPAEQMVAELNEIFAAFDDICDANGIEKIKTIGDAYMAASGVPVPCDDHAQRAVRAGLAMCAFLAERNKTASFKWSLRVGIHSGPVVAGVVGKRKYAFDVWGDTVNIASRLESAGEVGRVNVSAYTHHLIQDDFQSEYRGRVDAKGKGEVDMYFVTRALSS